MSSTISTGSSGLQVFDDVSSVFDDGSSTMGLQVPFCVKDDGFSTMGLQERVEFCFFVYWGNKFSEVFCDLLVFFWLYAKKS